MPERITSASPVLVAGLAAAIPCLALISSYLISAASGDVSWCVPMLQGCTSISKAARQDNSVVLFRALMIPAALIISLFWIFAADWLRQLGDDSAGWLRAMRAVGVIGALFLIPYVIFLGTHGPGYAWMRRFGVIIYFAGTGIAQLMLLRSVDRLSRRLGRGDLKGYGRLFCLNLYLMLALALSQAFVSTVTPSDALDNVIEWNYAILMHLFFIVAAIAWLQTDFRFEGSRARRSGQPALS